MEKSFKHLKVPESLLNVNTQTRMCGGSLLIKELSKQPAAYYDKIETVSGWARTLRKQGKEGDRLIFIDLCDGSGIKSL